MEDTLRMIVQHAEGNNDFLDRLHGVRRICNANGYELDAEEGMSHNKVHFVVMQIWDLLVFVEKTLVTE